MFSFFNESGRKENESSIIQPSTLIRPDLNLFDERSGSKICLSPNKRLAAVTDNFGRIILFDLQNMIAVRIWKGYRKAEIGWITVNENERIHKIDNENERNSKDNPKRAFFLIFYVPKRGILEIWPAQTGPRVTAFNVGKNCRLIHLDFTMFGLNYLVLKNIKKSMSNHHEFENYFQQSRCFLFNYEKAQIFTINIPFLCSFTDRNDKKARDVHVLKDLKLLFKKDDSNLETSKLLEKVIKLLLMLKTAEIRRESIEQLIKLANDCELIIFSLEKLRDHLLEMLKNNQLDFENKLIVQMCSRIIQLCHYYSDVQKQFQDNSLNEQFQRIVDESKNPPEINDLNEKLDKWSGSDLVRLLSLIAFRQSVLKPNVSNPNNSFSLKIGEFLNYFTLYYNHLFKHNQEDEMYEKLPIEVILMKEENKKSENNQGGENMPYPFLDTQSIQLERLSIFLFWSTFIGDQENIDRLLSDVCLSPSNLLLLLFNAWLNCSASNFWPCWPSFYRSFTLIIDLIVENAKISNQKQQSSSNRITSLDFSTLDLDDLHLSSSWTSILMMIYQSNNIPSTLIAIQVIKVLIARMKSDRKLSNDNADAKDADEINEDLSAKADTDNPFFNSDNEWETLHFDEENLSFLAKQLEDLFLLDLLLKSVSKDSNETNDDRKSSSSASSKNKDSISLSFILTNGPGIVSEIVARWAVHHNIEPDLLLDSKHCSESSKQDDSMAEKDLHEKFEFLIEILMQKHGIECAAIAAYKLEHLNAQSTLIEVLDHVRRCFPNCLDSDILLINCFWELLLQWNTEPLLKTKELSRALTYLVKVSSSVLRHNIASMSWRLFVQKRFATLCGLIEKMGKKPKDRISRKELEMDENDLESFCEFCTNLIDFMIRTSACSETDAVPLFTIDDWWQSFNSLSFNSSSIQTQNIQSLSSWPSNAPLALIAMHQKTANIDLLIEYYHLSQCIQFAVIFSLRNVRPFALFSSTVRGYFFQESLQSFIIDQQENAKGVALSSDPVLYESRMKFLSNVIVGIIQTLPINNVKG
ncbi:rab3 GTPase-activating protein non-catalytic subunit-like protein [Sarcoptes scabiei]|uniref:Rab3 GTPase-activating protein non-catalytic subunit-like protein n=1 Tax=Sarcoptes scabiei TaxID=52283 RepID=A0A132A8Q0_SARSC|nr:rab3 GTPase-activating protein non-catalytic subunit-like protein [Sarcoptes scabiei]